MTEPLALWLRAIRWQFLDADGGRPQKPALIPLTVEILAYIE